MEAWRGVGCDKAQTSQTLLDGFVQLSEECIQGANREVGALLGGELRTC